MQLSVVIPTHRRSDALPRTLDHLERQSIASDDFEVIVVGDAEGDEPDEVEHSIGQRRFTVRRLDRHAPGVSAARNDGWRAATAPVVMFLGDDILAARDLLAQHLAWHVRHPEETTAVLGNVRWARELRRDAFMTWLDAGVVRFYTSNVSLKRALLERAGGFDAQRFPVVYADIDLGLRLGELGFRSVYNPKARAEHLHQPKLEEWKSRMAATAEEEHTFIAHHPHEPAYFHDLFEEIRRREPVSPPRAGLLSVVPRWTPLLGKSIRENADIWFRQQLGRPFLEAWDRL